MAKAAQGWHPARLSRTRYVVAHREILIKL